MDINIKKFSEALKDAKKILLINHVRIDGDAFGSVGSFYFLLKKLGYEVKATNDDKANEMFDFLTHEEFIDETVNIKDYNPDMIIALDSASLSQLGEKYTNYKEQFDQAVFVAIDHHYTNHAYGDINIIYPESSSACEISYHVIKELGYEDQIDGEMATMLLTGIYTDTNNFFNANTSAQTLYTAARLVELGANAREPIYQLFKKKQVNKSKLWGEILKDLQTDLDGKIVYASVTQDYFERTGTTTGELSGLINEFLSNIEDMDVCFLVYELSHGGVKVSMRSQVFNVASFSECFGGGGHIQAAGFVSNKDIDTVKKEILEKLKKELK